tara:strand:+ start:1728 stop:1877 length:150 start_codon:yes stop_codon:yes gene_type:complete
LPPAGAKIKRFFIKKAPTYRPIGEGKNRKEFLSYMVDILIAVTFLKYTG